MPRASEKAVKKAPVKKSPAKKAAAKKPAAAVVAAPKKVAKKTAAPVAAAVKSASNAAPRSALRGGHVDAERYSKDPGAVNARVVEKTERAIVQLSNMIARFEVKGEDDKPEVKKARKAIELLESVQKALA
jgi:hypothetical protein